MDWLDVVLIGAVVLAGIHGLRLGALMQVLTFGGFWLGLTLGTLLAAAVVSSVSGTSARTVVTLVAVLGLGILLGTAGRAVGAWSNALLRRIHLGPVDAVAGAAVAMVAVLLTAWVVAGFLSQTNYRGLDSAISGSAVLRAVDDTLPPVPSLYARIEAFLASRDLPPVFAGLEPLAAGRVPPASAAEARAIANRAEASTVKVLGEACGQELEGSAFVVAPGTVVTNAHVVAGESSTQVVVNGADYAATPILFDPNFDLAVLRTDALLGTPLVLDAGLASRGTKAAVLGYPENGPFDVQPAGVAANILAQGRNIYNEGLVVRDVYQIDATVRPGNSGGPLVAADGNVIGVVFSRSTVSPGVGYALASPGVLSRVDQVVGRTARVGTGACTAG